jgi:hypothetical protein
MPEPFAPTQLRSSLVRSAPAHPFLLCRPAPALSAPHAAVRLLGPPTPVRCAAHPAPSAHAPAPTSAPAPPSTYTRHHLPRASPLLTPIARARLSRPALAPARRRLGLLLARAAASGSCSRAPPLHHRTKLRQPARPSASRRLRLPEPPLASGSRAPLSRAAPPAARPCTRRACAREPRARAAPCAARLDPPCSLGPLAWSPSAWTCAAGTEQRERGKGAGREKRIGQSCRRWGRR